MDVNKDRIAAARNNLMRYRRILATPLTDLERAYVQQRIAEQKIILEQLEAPACEDGPEAGAARERNSSLSRLYSLA
jgi:hypothetical protein